LEEKISLDAKVAGAAGAKGLGYQDGEEQEVGLPAEKGKKGFNYERGEKKSKRRPATVRVCSESDLSENGIRGQGGTARPGQGGRDKRGKGEKGHERKKKKTDDRGPHGKAQERMANVTANPNAYGKPSGVI